MQSRLSQFVINTFYIHFPWFSTHAPDRTGKCGTTQSLEWHKNAHTLARLRKSLTGARFNWRVSRAADETELNADGKCSFGVRFGWICHNKRLCSVAIALPFVVDRKMAAAQPAFPLQNCRKTASVQLLVISAIYKFTLELPVLLFLHWLQVMSVPVIDAVTAMLGVGERWWAAQISVLSTRCHSPYFWHLFSQSVH